MVYVLRFFVSKDALNILNKLARKPQELSADAGKIVK